MFCVCGIYQRVLRKKMKVKTKFKPLSWKKLLSNYFNFNPDYAIGFVVTTPRNRIVIAYFGFNHLKI